MINEVPSNTKNKLKARTMATFTNLHKETVGRSAKDPEVVSGMSLKPSLTSLNKFSP